MKNLKSVVQVFLAVFFVLGFGAVFFEDSACGRRPRTLWPRIFSITLFGYMAADPMYRSGFIPSRFMRFLAARVARQVKNSAKAVFPNEAFVVSSFVNRVEVMYPSNSKIAAAEINMFKTLFCDLTKTKKEELLFSQYERKAV